MEFLYNEECCVVTKVAFRVRQPWAGILALLLASCVSLCKLSNFPRFQFLLDLVGCKKNLVTLQYLEGLQKQYAT